MENETNSGVSTNASSVNSSLLLTTQKASFVTFHHPMSIKLDEKNYLVWRQQTLAVIYGHELEKFINEDTERSHKFASTEDELAGKISDDYLA